MSKLKHSVMLLFLMSVSNSSYSQEDVDIAQSALDHVAEKYCSVNAEIYQRCFNLDEAQCRQVYQGIIETCRQNDDGFPIQDDAQAISAFKDCAVTAFLSYLESTGLDLEASCEQSGGELDNTKEDARNIQHPITEPVQNVASQLNENPSDEKKHMPISAGKPKVFSSEKEIAEAKAELKNAISLSRYALLGSFDPESKSDFVEHGKYPGGGYYLIDFKIIRYLGKMKKPVSIMKIRVPRELIRVADQEYLREVEATMNRLFRELQSVMREHESGDITTEEFDIYNTEWKERARSMDHARYFGQRIKHGLNYSLKRSQPGSQLTCNKCTMS